MTQERLSDISLGLLSIERHFKDIAKMPLFLNLLLLKRERAYSSLVDIMTLTKLDEVSYVLYSVG